MSLADVSGLYLAALLQLAAVAVLLSASWRLAGGLWPAPNRAEQLLVAGLLFCSLAVVIVIGLGLIGLLQPALVGAVVVALWAGARWKVPAGEELPKLEWPVELRWPLLLCALAVVPFLLRALVWVPLAWDELTYHLFYPAVWIQTGSVFLVDGVYPYNYLAYYPKNHELIDTFLMVIVRNDAFVKLLNFPLAALTGVAAGVLCVQLGGSRLAGWCAGLFVFTIPAMFCWVATTYVEPLLNFAILAAVCFVVRAFKSERHEFWRCGLLAGLALGLAAGTKFTALYLVVLMFPIVVAVPLVRQLGRKQALYFPALFTVGCLLTGIWWYACNTVVTGNPVYPVSFGPLNAIRDPDRPTIHESSIWTDFPRLVESGQLAGVWFGDLAWVEFRSGEAPSFARLWAAGPPAAMGLGPKLVLILPLFVLGLVFALKRRKECGRCRDWAGAAAIVTAAALALIMLYTYLKVPLWGEDGAMYCQVRFAMPFVCLAVVMGFAALGHTRLAACLPLLTLVGVVGDLVTLDLRLPGWIPLFSIVLLAVVGVCLLLFSRVTVPARAVWRLAGLAIFVGLFPLLVHRENQRYDQWSKCAEVHGGYQRWFAPVAELLDRQHPGASLAYAGDFASYLYMFMGPRFDRSICYVSTWDGPALSYLKQGTLRDKLDKGAWEKNLKASGAQLLISFRFCDRQLEASYSWPAEYHWAETLEFPLLYKNSHCSIHQVVFSAKKGYSGRTELSQGR